MNLSEIAPGGGSDPADVLFVSRRNCSIGPRGLFAVFASLSLLSFGFGLAFAAHGPWLILPFAGLEMLVLGVAFVACGRGAGDFEQIRVAAHAVTVFQVVRNRQSVREFNPRWARLAITRRPQGVSVVLSQSGKHTELGRYLGFERRLAFAAEFSSAFQRAARA